MSARRETNDSMAVSVTYAGLRKQIQEILAQAQEKIEHLKVRTYWQMGRQIHEHVLHHKNRADYGKKVIARLARDLEISETILYRSQEFFEKFPIFAARQKLSWAHYRALLSISDETTRKNLAEQAERANWTSRELESKIKSLAALHSKKSLSAQPLARSLKLKAPSIGSLHHYQIKNSENLHPVRDKLQISNGVHWNRATLLVDLGFTVYLEAERFELQKIKEGDIVRSVKEEHDIYNVTKAKEATRDSLFTFKAFVERVIDGDTLKLQIDLGFGIWTRQVIRLRGLDAPEIGTKEGMRAKRFLEAELQKTAFVLLKSTRSDKYDRYLGDLFTETGQGTATDPTAKGRGLGRCEYLNQKLLDAGLAKAV